MKDLKHLQKEQNHVKLIKTIPSCLLSKLFFALSE